MTEVELTIDKLVHGGQGLAHDGAGPIFVWGGLPGEVVQARITKRKRTHREAVVVSVVESSVSRVESRDEAYLSTSPWQIMNDDYEGHEKQRILTEVFSNLDRDMPAVGFEQADHAYGYRNKMEYSFYGDDDGLHLALYERGSHRKRIVQGSSLAMQQIDEVARAVVKNLSQLGIRASSLKSLLLRASQNGQVCAALFVKDEAFAEVPQLADVCQGARVIYSTPKSPASVVTRELYAYGDTTLHDEIMGRRFYYDVRSFFQVNVGMFERALRTIADWVQGDEQIVDMYSGVGAIGLSVGASSLVEIDPANVAMAQHNARGSAAEVMQVSTERALDAITPDATIIFDPPRSGMHRKLIERINEVGPKKIVYLSCNPMTQVRDIAGLSDAYKVRRLIGYNFFPKTPHIESLALIERE